MFDIIESYLHIIYLIIFFKPTNLITELRCDEIVILELLINLYLNLNVLGIKLQTFIACSYNRTN